MGRKLPVTNRRQPVTRRTIVLLNTCFAVVMLVAVLAVFYLAPEDSDKPLVKVHAPPSCVECQDWMEHLRRRGLRVISGTPEEGEHIRRELRLPPGFSTTVVASVGGHHISGLVPVREIHQLIRREAGRGVIGVAVRAGPDSPWKPAAIASQGLTVFAVLPGGMLRPLTVYHGPGLKD